MSKKFNPFVLSGYESPKYFCNREEESKQLKELMLSGTHTTLFAIRRLGKTGLIHHVFYPYKNSKEVACLYLDVLSTNNLTEFTNKIATAVYNKFPPQNSFGKKVIELFKRFRPVISYDELTGLPSLSLTLETQTQKEQTIGSIFSFLDEQGMKVVFAIDEFQQILEYPEKNTEAILRTTMQQLKNTSFVFCGSNQKLMHEIFNSSKRPFFASCTHLSLGFIEEKEYKKFIAKKFREHQKEINQETLDFVCGWTCLHTFYTQSLCHKLFSQAKSKYTIEDARSAAYSILKINESIFYQYKNLLTKAQWNLLCAIAKEEQIRQPTAKKFIQDHQLGTPALVKRGLDALLKKELAFHNTGVEKPYYEVYDKFLMRWIELNF